MATEAYLTVDESNIVAKYFPRIRLSERFFNPYVKSGMNFFGVSYAPRRRVGVQVEANSIRHIRFERGWRRAFVLLPVYDESIELGLADGSKITFHRSQEVHFDGYKLALARFAVRNGVEIVEDGEAAEPAECVARFEDALRAGRSKARTAVLVLAAVWFAAVLAWLIVAAGIPAEFAEANFEPSLRMLLLPFATYGLVIARLAALPLWQVLMLVLPAGVIIWFGARK